ncbi:DNA ligase 1 isoform X1 [Tachyglossus aculeatus]|uniref:DNA ligase 1 isoform X1 n=1 Tax=Tachyglossus aculeatus TaxID=9261 RepID=UPI0018F7B5C0|nr:DNA ligase 1 isoform X1 [Tachyglossus aculeatus]
MQRTIMSFFQPMKGDRAKKEEKTPAEGSKATEPPPKATLKERSGVEPAGDSPVKRPGKKTVRALGSEGEEEDDDEIRAEEEPEGVQPAAEAPPQASLRQEPASTSASPREPSGPAASPVVSPSSSLVLSESPGVSPSGSSPLSIPKRRTARKQLPKRKLGESPDSEEAGVSPQGESEAKKSKKEEEPREPAEEGERAAAVKAGSPEEKPGKVAGTGRTERDEKKQPKLRSSVSSFFAPLKPAEKGAEKENALAKKPQETVTSSSPSPPDLPDPASYSPSKPNYHPTQDACWRHGQRVPYLAVARTFEKIEEVSARLRIIETLSNLFRSVISLSPADLLPCIYLCLNRLGPAHEGLELGVGDTVLLKAIAQATGRQLDAVRAEAAERGDVGLVAESSRSTQRTVFAPAPLTVTGVFAKLKEIAKMVGNASMNKKIEVIKGLFVACRHSEARFIARSLSGKLRIGLAEQSVLAAIAQAATLTPPSQGYPPEVPDAGKGKSAEARKAWIEERVMIVKQTLCEVPNYDTIIPVLLEHGVESLPDRCKLTPGVPLKPMLAHPTKGVGEVLKRFEEAAFTCEYKYDGQRAQIHILESGEVRIYSRNQEDNTARYPDVIARVPKMKKASVTSCILDTEAVAWDRDRKQIQPFQVLTTRKRKEVDAAEIKVQVCIYAFDIIYLNGESLVRQPLSRRRQLLHEHFLETEGEFVFATALDSADTDQISEFLEQSVRDSCEGLMVKTLDVDATYEIAKRSHNWLKLKKDYLEGVGDTLDLVVIGVYLGRGKRAGRYGGFLLAAYDDEGEEYQAVCKLGTGFSDEELDRHHRTLQDHVLPAPRPYYRCDGSVAPDHWVEAAEVWEVKCADLSLSPIYPAAVGLVDSEKGISLRFPRFVRVRSDKKPEEATTSAQVASLYQKQQQIQNQQGSAPGSDPDPEDFY